MLNHPPTLSLQHTYAHHSFTNNNELDPDTQHFKVMLRMHEKNDYRPRMHQWLVYR